MSFIGCGDRETGRPRWYSTDDDGDGGGEHREGGRVFSALEGLGGRFLCSEV